MEKLATFLVLTSIALILYSIWLKLTGCAVIHLGLFKVELRTGLSLSIFLMMLAILIKVSIEKTGFVINDIKILFWLTSIVAVGLLTIFLMTSIEKLSEAKVIERFHRIYYSTTPYHISSYLGIPTQQYPNDNWVMQEIISEIEPGFIIETGTDMGGTALFYATVLEKVNRNGKVISIDIKPHDPKVTEFEVWRERVEFVMGDSVSPTVVEPIARRIRGQKVIVTLDSDHSKKHVLKELELYSPLVPLNSYIVVQDTHLGGHPNYHPSVAEGPWEAVEEFLKISKDFVIDRHWEKHLITQNPSGFLKRIR